MHPPTSIISDQLQGMAWRTKNKTDRQQLKQAAKRLDAQTVALGALRAKRKALLACLTRAEEFVAGFEDDPLQEGIATLLTELRLLSRKRGEVGQ